MRFGRAPGRVIPMSFWSDPSMRFGDLALKSNPPAPSGKPLWQLPVQPIAWAGAAGQAGVPCILSQALTSCMRPRPLCSFGGLRVHIDCCQRVQDSFCGSFMESLRARGAKPNSNMRFTQMPGLRTPLLAALRGYRNPRSSEPPFRSCKLTLPDDPRWRQVSRWLNASNTCCRPLGHAPRRASWRPLEPLRTLSPKTLKLCAPGTRVFARK